MQNLNSYLAFGHITVLSVSIINNCVISDTDWSLYVYVDPAELSCHWLGNDQKEKQVVTNPQVA
jgi:hypothetical protein